MGSDKCHFSHGLQSDAIGECGLTFSAQSEMLVPGKNLSWHERDKICQTGEGSQKDLWIS